MSNASSALTYEDAALHFVSDGVPNHERNAQYALPNGGVMVPDALTATAGDDPTVAQVYDFTIPLTPTKASALTSTSLGNIGLMLSGASLFNSYEGGRGNRGHGVELLGVGGRRQRGLVPR